MKHIGIFGGTFNPVHNGHLALAEWLLDHGHCEEVRLMLSPQNPLKGDHFEANDLQRMEMLNLACERIEGLTPCFLEFDMPRPSYTIDTLSRLSATNPECKFSLIIGSDNWLIFNRWRNYEEILRGYGVIVYPRPHYPIISVNNDEITYVEDAPITDISSTEIRANIYENMKFLPIKVAEYIKENSLYGYVKK